MVMFRQVHPPPDRCCHCLKLGHRELHEEAEVVVGGENLLDGLDEFFLGHGVH